MEEAETARAVGCCRGLAVAFALFVYLDANVMIGDRLFRNFPAPDVLFMPKSLLTSIHFLLVHPSPEGLRFILRAGGIFRGLMCLLYVSKIFACSRRPEGR